PPVATPAKTSASGKVSKIRLLISDFITSLVKGKDRIRRLSQYTGDFQPEDHVNGFWMFNCIALICNNFSAICRALFFIRQTYMKLMKPQPLIMQKLYIHNKPVILYSEDDNIKKEESNFLNITQPAPREIPSILKDLDKESTNGIRIKTNQSDAFLEALFSYFQHWKAAGGLITNPKGEILLLFRRGKWDLPK